MLKLATILQNPGEPAFDTRYNNPDELKQLGYNGVVLYETTALSGVGGVSAVGDPEIQHWAETQLATVTKRVAEAHRAGLAVYICYDVMSLARTAVQRGGDDLTCIDRSDMLCPASQSLLTRCGEALQQLIEHLPSVDGVVIRLGDSNATRLPYLVGNDVYQPRCPRCKSVDPARRAFNVLEHYHRLVVEQMGKRLIARAWNVRPGGMHDSVDVCRQVVSLLDSAWADDSNRFILSFKFTQTDFWRYQQWNPSSLAVGSWPIIYELQCQREFEGKGGIPNWQAPLWRDGAPECDEPNQGGAGLAHIVDRVNLSGLWAWVRGGGWGGPFVKDETWIDANVFAVPALADDPAASCDALAKRWIKDRISVTDPALADVIHRVMEHSREVILKGFYIGPDAKDQDEPWNPNGQLIQDDLIDANEAWRIIQGLAENQLDAVVREKQQAVDLLAGDRASLQRFNLDEGRAVSGALINTLLYAESLFMTLRDLLAGLVAYRRYFGGDRDSAETCRRMLFAAQSSWNHHTQRHGALPGTATSFREENFWELTQQILDEIDEVGVR